jgi:hypothetical protein
MKTRNFLFVLNMNFFLMIIVVYLHVKFVVITRKVPRTIQSLFKVFVGLYFFTVLLLVR